MRLEPPRLPDRLYRTLCRLWALGIGGSFLLATALTVKASLEAWYVGERIDRPGQLTLYNDAPEGGKFGLPVELGDFDGDGLVDLVMAPMAAGAGPERERRFAGEVDIHPGSGEIAGILDESLLRGRDRGLTLWGEREDDMLGVEIFTADVNGDGLEDLIMGAQNYDGPNADRDNAGGAYVLFGREGLLDEARVIDLRDREEGIVRIVGAEPGERLGVWVEAGDLDGDGVQDILLGADQYPAFPLDPELRRGRVWVIYGRSEFPAEIDLATFTDGVSAIAGRDPEDHFGGCLHARDLNADGVDDLIVASSISRLSAAIPGDSVFDSRPTEAADGPLNTRQLAGEVTVIFGKPGGGRLPSRVDLAEPLSPELSARITTIHGGASREFVGEEITSGDFDGDGFPDLVLGALAAESTKFPEFPDFPAHRRAGKAYVIYWQAGLEGRTIDLAPERIDPLPPGLRISMLQGLHEDDILGDTLSAGDLDRDGRDDLAVGIPHASPDGNWRAGSVAIVFGRPEAFPEVFWPQADPLPERLEVSFVLGHRSQDLLSYSMEARDVDLDGYADLYPNAMHGERSSPTNRNSGAAYLISGYHLSGATLDVRSVRPASGRADRSTEVRVRGDGFTTTADTDVFVGETPAESFTVVSRYEIVAVLPALGAGPRLPLRVTNRHGSVALEDAFRYLAPGTFVRGDTDLDERLTITDPIRTLRHLFAGELLSCEVAADADDNGFVEVTDVIYVLAFLFRGGASPPAPFPDPGEDPTPRAGLECGI